MAEREHIRRGADQETDRLSRQCTTHIDEVISVHGEPSVSSLPVLYSDSDLTRVVSFQHTDSSFETGSPLLPFTEPALF